MKWARWWLTLILDLLRRDQPGSRKLRLVQLKLLLKRKDSFEAWAALVAMVWIVSVTLAVVVLSVT